MTVYLYTHDLFPGREQLMPWRTLIEVAAYLEKTEKYTAVILSSESDPRDKTRTFRGISILSVPKPGKGDNILPKHTPEDILIWPVTWRTRNTSFSVTRDFRGKKIAYFPGGVYSLRNIAGAFGSLPFNTMLPYLADSLTPPRQLAARLKANGFDHAVAFSGYTAETLASAGWPKEKTTVILPGFDNFNRPEPDTAWFTKFALEGRKYMLFMGSPAAIRGSSLLLKAFDRFASREHDACLVCLLREDPGSNKNDFDKTLAAMQFPDRVKTYWGKMTQGELRPFIENARAVILPFLLIPSEIPVTFFEVLSMGIPVITFENGGTSRYIRPAAVICKPSSTSSLEEGIRSLWDGNDVWQQKKNNALQLICEHPNWEQMSQLWEKTIAECSLS